MSEKRELLDAEAHAWAELAKRFDAVPADAWDRPGAAGDWCAKDVAAHVACWQAQLTDWLEAWRVAGEKPGEIDFQVYNERFHERCAGLTLPDVQAMLGASRHRAREELGQMEEPIPRGWVRAIETCLHEHYAEHIPELDAFLGRKL